MRDIILDPHPSGSSTVSPVLDLIALSERAASVERHHRTPELSIVVLAYQEEARIGRSLLELSAHLARTGRRGVEVVVVVATRPDGTSDRTREIVEGKQALFENLRIVLPGAKAGKGRDAKYGMLVARGRMRIFMDADLATPLHHLQRAVELAEAGNDAVLAVRDLTSSHRGLRRIISSAGNRLVQAVLLPGISDTQCGFKLFSAAAAEQVFRRQTIDGWGFDMEVLAVARRLGLGVATFDVPDWTDVPGGTFGDKAVVGALRTLQDLMRIRWRVATGSYRHLQPLPAPTVVAWHREPAVERRLMSQAG